MRTNILITIFAIMLFAVVGSAQQLVRFNSDNIDPMSPSRPGAIPTLDALEGRPFKISIHRAKTERATPNLIIAPVKGKTFKSVPCGRGERLTTGNSDEKVEVYLEIKLESTLVSSYMISGHEGSCGLLGIRLWDGSEYFGKIRFVRAR